jgi:Ca-activated chloride channel family protein
MSTMMSAPTQSAASCGGRMVAEDGRELVLAACSIEASTKAGLAQVTLRQTFRNVFTEPLRLTYQVPLPADAAVGGYCFKLDGRTVTGGIETREQARERFEEAIVGGRTAALLEQERTSFFTQQLGNVPPGGEISCELTLDQKLRWLEDGQWEWRFPTVIAPRYMGAAGKVADQGKVEIDVLEHGNAARAELALLIRDSIEDMPTSPTHQIRCVEHDGGRLVQLADERGTRLDRDIAVRWDAASTAPAINLDLARPSAEGPLSSTAYGLLTITPPSSDQSAKSFPRDLIALIDTSGSMHGSPLEQAKLVLLELINSLDQRDTLELVSFSSRPERWASEPRACSDLVRAEASAWVRALEAGGGTEMESGVREALAPVRSDAQRQVILITDGLIGFEKNIVRQVARHAAQGCRVHTVGVGPAANRSLTSAVARAGRGGELMVGLTEDAGETAARLLARVSKPLMTNVTIEGSAVLQTASDTAPDLMGGCPSLVPIRLSPLGGELHIRGAGVDGRWARTVEVPPCEIGTGSASIVRLFGRELAEELETRGGPGIDEMLTRIGLDYRISTRCTSWIAVSEDQTVDPKAPSKRVRLAQSLPEGLSAGGLGLDRAQYSQRIEVEGSDAVMRPPPMCPRPEYHLDEEPVHDDLDLAPASPRASRCIVGVLRSLRDGRAVIEIELRDYLNWRPKRVRVPNAPQVTISKDGTTRTGEYAAGQTVRLILDNLPARITDQDLASLEIDMGPLAPAIKLEIRPS